MRRLQVVICLCMFMVLISLVLAGQGEPYGLISAVKTECEYQGLTWGTRLSDAFNSYDESIPYYRRVHHNIHQSNPAFTRLVHIETTHHNLPQLHTSPSTHDNNRLLSGAHHTAHGHKEHAHAGHHGHNNTHSFRALSGKRIHLIGDGTLLPILRSLILPSYSHEVGWDFDAWKNDMCEAPTVPSSKSKSILPEPHRYFCNSTGYGMNGLITYNRHDTLLEDYKPDTLNAFLTSSVMTPPSTASSTASASANLYASSLLTSSETINPNNTIFVVQLGYTACVAPFLADGAQLEDYVKVVEGNVKGFFKEWNEAMQPYVGQKGNVIISLPGRGFPQDRNGPPGQINRLSDICTSRLNRMIAYQAHFYGWMLLEREEIEHRLILKSDYTEEPIRSIQSLLSFPAPQIVTASLVSMLHCVDEQQTFDLL